jgi:uncharacterized protein (DUF4415 family)
MRNVTTTSNTETDWDRLDSLTDDEIDLTEIPELTSEAFAYAVVRHGLKAAERKVQLTLRVDRDVLAWFKSQGKGYQTRINELLRAYMEASISRTRS